MQQLGNQSIDVITFPVAPLGCNCSILISKNTKETIVVDPGGEAEKIISNLEKNDCRVVAIVHTHAHFDHVLGTADVAKHARLKTEDVKVCLHEGDFFLYDNLPMQCKWFGLPAFKTEEKINHKLEDEETFQFGDQTLKVLFTPGHTPGSCSFSVDGAGLLFSGDTLFAGAIGRTDLPGGDPELILKSIENRIFTLDEGTVVVPGHGGFTRVFEEKKYNPFF